MTKLSKRSFIKVVNENMNERAEELKGKNDMVGEVVPEV